MTDLISREALLDVYFKKCNRECCTCIERDDESGDCGLIRDAPAVDAEPVRHGHYGFVGMHIGRVYASHGTCSVCKARILIDPAHKKYCPECGAKMVEEEP